MSAEALTVRLTDRQRAKVDRQLLDVKLALLAAGLSPYERARLEKLRTELKIARAGVVTRHNRAYLRAL